MFCFPYILSNLETLGNKIFIFSIFNRKFINYGYGEKILIQIWSGIEIPCLM